MLYPFEIVTSPLPCFCRSFFMMSTIWLVRMFSDLQETAQYVPEAEIQRLKVFEKRMGFARVMDCYR